MADRGGKVGWFIKAVALMAAGFMLSAAAPPADPLDQPMTFSAEDDTLANRVAAEMSDGGERKIYAVGEITPGTTGRFKAFMRSRGITNARIVLDSPGGSLIEGMKLGEAIRQGGFDTTIGTMRDRIAASTAICASACAYTFAGGVNRFLGQYSGRLGLHQFYSESGATGDVGTTQQISGVLVSYLQQMGVDADAFSIATLSKPTGVYWLTLAEAQELRFSNDGVSPTKAELKMVSMTPYLRLEQEKFNFTARVLFICQDHQVSIAAGVVTSPEASREHVLGLRRAYLELDGTDGFVMSGAAAAVADGSVVWIRRVMSPQDAAALLATHDLGMWTEGGGAIRWGGNIDLSRVHDQMRSYFSQCVG